MSSSLNRLRFTILRSTYRVRPRRTSKWSIPPACAFHTSLVNRREASEEEPEASAPLPFPACLESEDLAEYESLTPPERKEYEETYRKLIAHLSSPRVESEIQAEISNAVYELNSEVPPEVIPHEKIQPGLMAMGEVEEEDSGEDEEFQGDDISSLAQGELEQHREIREYARIAAWEMPLLAKLAKPFVPPAQDAPLRFRYTTYMGETHPASKKVVLEFCPADLPDLTHAQRLKLIKLVGVRYDPQKDLVKMSSEMFETQAQNKRYLGDLVDTLMTEAKDESDMFEDVPVDFRHVKIREKVRFPEEWKLTAERKARLKEEREARMRADVERIENGTIIDGLSLIDAAHKMMPVAEAKPLLMEAKRGAGRGKVPRKRYV